ncbi:hypothetical protein KFK09_018131 [Dendrobium nobile]|uniref:Cyanobacterial aminoacyl-tRNA synthetase CAAD domain-containing protein n=1 Tax=Dendrobium nobile TaxID=94219 RepID=A0A8T3ATZ8_DENNO|nr:hypothetical protein KFK09_018131 [Dendrobium nobile]
MASATGTAIRILASSPTPANRRLNSHKPVSVVNSHLIGLNSLPPPLQVSSPVRHPQDREFLKPVFYSHKSTRNIVVRATGERPAEVATELPEIVTTIQEAWDRLDDKYAVASLAFATVIALYGSIGLISAIDRLPLLPGLFELIGIGYTGWFAYRYLVFKPDREALIAKVKSIYGDVIGSG